MFDLDALFLSFVGKFGFKKLQPDIILGKLKTYEVRAYV